MNLPQKSQTVRGAELRIIAGYASASEVQMANLGAFKLRMLLAKHGDIRLATNKHLPPPRLSVFIMTGAIALTRTLWGASRRAEWRVKVRVALAAESCGAFGPPS